MSWPTKFLLALGALLLACSAAQAATIPVTTTADGDRRHERRPLLAARGRLRRARRRRRQGCPAGSAADVDTIALGPGTFDARPVAGGQRGPRRDRRPRHRARSMPCGSSAPGAGATVIDALRRRPRLRRASGSSLTLEVARGHARGRSDPGGERRRGPQPGRAHRRARLHSRTTSPVTAAPTALASREAPGGAIWSGGPANTSVTDRRHPLPRQRGRDGPRAASRGPPSPAAAAAATAARSRSRPGPLDDLGEHVRREPGGRRRRGIERRRRRRSRRRGRRRRRASR